MAEILVLAELNAAGGGVRKTTLEALTAARALGEPSAVVIGAPGTAAGIRDTLAEYGAATVYVAESERGRCYGVRCLSQLARELLLRSESVCLLVNELNAPARSFYQKAGFKPRGVFDTVFLKR